ncbi:hypothetical protein PV08_08800 [Exophiala spinifera]|uniref:CorA-like transporter domain-containing protein n=1 Tax=Exophiala spinifera TaxID=91928 RepID=A0A0D2B4J8_9EURO|nr:uncharacterized protein PV08_08800 [Exophiala spinifera]KIW13610.1 hypothetical protein PV08_08800 [Exophiala spinifera]
MFVETFTDYDDIELCYRVSFFEENHRNRGDSWSLRQTGVYQRFSGSPGQSAGIILQPSQRIRPWIEEYLRSAKFRSDYPMMLHVLMLAALAATWTSYVQHLSTQLRELDEKVSFSSEPKCRRYDYEVCFADCQTLHLFRSKLLRASLVIDDNLQLASNFASLTSECGSGMTDTQERELSNNIRAYTSEMAIHKRNIAFLLDESTNTASLLSKLLEARMSTSLRVINQTMESNLSLIRNTSTNTLQENLTIATIAKQGTKGSRKIHALTLIATLYLPATLVATVFSSNLIQWKDEGDDPTTGSHFKAHYTVVSEFWIYVVSTLVLMVTTLVIARVLERVD